jgi:hypothetical protein
MPEKNPGGTCDGEPLVPGRIAVSVKRWSTTMVSRCAASVGLAEPLVFTTTRLHSLAFMTRLR